jgi:glyoxylase-like metal-dependent hydrolase (beta-lactamase superfamily II)
MKIHHLNAGSMREIAPGNDLKPARALNHVLLVETDKALVLVDTGFGTADSEATLGRTFMQRTQPRLEPQETALRQVKNLGYEPEDVRHVVLTHLDLDHTGGLPDFPQATVHLHEAELQAAMTPGNSHPEHDLRYRPAHWAHHPQWTTYQSRKGNSWYGFDALELAGLTDILLIPLAGHTEGHSAVAVRDGDRWLLHAGDAFYHHGQIEADNRWSMPMWEALEEITEIDRPLRMANQARLRELVRDHGDEVDVFSAHDPWAFQRYEGMVPAL